MTGQAELEVEPTEPEGWQGITDDALAVWAMDKLAAYTAERDRIRRNAKAYLEQIQFDAIADERTVADKIAWFTVELIAYYTTLPDQPSTYKLPNGVIQRRKGRASTKVLDLAAFIAWAAVHAPEAVKLTPLISELPPWPRSDDGQIIAPGGEIVPGVQVITADPTVTVKVSGRPE